jgi:hypothetical protein
MDWEDTMSVRITAEQAIRFLSRDVLPLLQAVKDGYDYDPGDSDSDDEQPIRVSITLGEYRRAVRLLPEVEKSV